MGTTATTTGPSSTSPESSAAVLDLLAGLTRLLLTWSFEGTFDAEAKVRRVAARYGAEVEVTFLADSAVLTVGDRTLSFARAPTVPPLDHVTELQHLLAEIEDGDLGAGEAAARLEAREAAPPRFSRATRAALDR
jgi:uncharacterized membrane protein YjjP (DUF1212 family)